MSYSPETQAVLDRILAKTQKNAWSATWWYAASSALTALMAWWLDDWRSWAWIFGFLGLLLAATWAYFLLTSYRIRKGYFGGNEQEAREIIAEIHSN